MSDPENSSCLGAQTLGRYCVKGFLPCCISFTPRKDVCPLLEMRKWRVEGYQVTYLGSLEPAMVSVLTLEPRADPLGWKGPWGITHAWHGWWAVHGCCEGPPAVGYQHHTWSSGQVPGREECLCGTDRATPLQPEGQLELTAFPAK